ncbi:MAG: CDP-6-deoxy-delta-3,4-glucoseen reductase [Burkholderiaceae bacterium]|jgi:CDP-4-dehydro-6-deoxyglucose reductase|nr:CDP-6-deoxy-delta-3,4-glucoseen reductase [Burkholderiaceae bacterium]
MAHKITVRPSGREFTVEGDETVLAAALRAGIGLPYGCKSGTCGTCKARCIDGAWTQGPHSATALSDDDIAQRKLLVCCSRPDSDLVIEARELSGFGDIPIRKMPCRVATIERPTDDVAIVSLNLPANERLQYRAGQYIEFILRDGTRRSYSMATAPHADAQIALHIRHMPGGLFTDTLFGAKTPALKERDILRFEGPLGTFFLREESTKPIVLLASGTGFAPIKAIAEHLFHKRVNLGEGDRPARPVRLYWGARTKKDLYLDALPRQWAAEQAHFSYVPVLSEATAADAWTGRTGFVHRAVMDDLPDLSGHEVYACGTPLMVEAARQDFIARCGLPEDAFFADAFTSQADLARTPSA